VCKKVLEISARSDIGGGPKHLLDLLKFNQNECPKNKLKLYSAIPFNSEYSDLIIQNSEGSIEIPHRKFSIWALFQIIKYCKQNNIRTIHSHGRGAGYYSRVLKLIGFRIIHTLHGVHIESGLISLIKLKLDQFLVSFTDMFICVSDGEKERALQYKIINSNKTVVIYNGIKLQEQVAYQQSDKSPIVIGLLGRLCHQKGYDILLTFLEKLLSEEKVPPIKVLIAGDGEEKSNLTKVLKNKKHTPKIINFMGMTKDPLGFLKELDFFMSFARFEGMPLSVLEAMSMGIPCLVSNVVGNQDVINDKNGYLFELDNYDSFKISFIKMISSNNEAQTKQANEDLRNLFNNSKQIVKTINLY
jgi:glycosyltransferase involved in cell wall biosynthesis